MKEWQRKFNPEDGSIQISTPNGRFYTKRESRRKYWSATTVLGIVDKSNWYVPWIISEALKSDSEDLRMKLTAYRRKNKRICDRGSRVHDWIEGWCHCPKLSYEGPEMEPGDEHFTDAFLKYFWQVYDVETISTEGRLFKDLYFCPEDFAVHDKDNQHYCDSECSCEFIGYAGTYDFYGRINGKLTLLDWKTSSSIKEENWMQLASYVEATDFPIEQVGIVRMKPETKSPRCQIIFKDVSELEAYWRSFKKRLILTHDVKGEI